MDILQVSAFYHHTFVSRRYLGRPNWAAQVHGGVPGWRGMRELKAQSSLFRGTTVRRSDIRGHGIERVRCIVSAGRWE